MRGRWWGIASVLVATCGSATASAAPSSSASAKPSAQSPTFALPLPPPPLAPKTDPIQLGPSSYQKPFNEAKPGTPQHVTTGLALAQSCRSVEVTVAEQTNAAWIKLANAQGDATLKSKFLEKRKIYENARQCVIRTYRAVADGDPSYAKGDEVLLYLGSEYASRRIFDPAEDEPLAATDADKERATFLELIKHWPNSRYVPTAYLVFGDLYFDAAMQAKVDWALPAEAYARAHDIDPKSIEGAYASYRLGYVGWNRGQLQQAKKMFERAIGEATALGSTPRASDLLAAAQTSRAQL